MNFMTDGPDDAKHVFVFAHGAGAPMDTPWMNTVARGVAAYGIRVVRFEFPYMAARRSGGKRGAPDRQPVLLQTWRDVIGELGRDVVIGGKSMGGRMATMVADELRVRGVAVLGYPFHPPGQPEKLRTAHLETMTTPALIVQGTRDPFGTQDDVAAYRISPTITIEWLQGQHSLSGKQLAAAIEVTATFVMQLT